MGSLIFKANKVNAFPSLTSVGEPISLKSQYACLNSLLDLLLKAISVLLKFITTQI
jgi:hypothetical protein